MHIIPKVLFDINGTPPTEADITNLHRQLASYKIKVKIAVVVVTAIILVVFPALYSWGTLSSEEGAGVISIAAVWTICALFVVATAIIFVASKDMMVSCFVVIVAGSAAVISIVLNHGGSSMIAVAMLIASMPWTIWVVTAAIDDQLELLEPIALANCIDVVNWCKQNSVVSAYQNQVSAQGRTLTDGEYKEMYKWLFANKNIIKEAAAAQRAYDALKAPIKPKVE